MCRVYSYNYSQPFRNEEVSACWVPRRLTSDQAQRCLEVATADLSRFNMEGENFLSGIVVIDKAWVRSYEPELKRQSAD